MLFPQVLQYKDVLVTNTLLLILLCRFNVVDLTLVLFKLFIIILLLFLYF
jgi:hypothetical protein